MRLKQTFPNVSKAERQPPQMRNSTLFYETRKQLARVSFDTPLASWKEVPGARIFSTDSVIVVTSCHMQRRERRRITSNASFAVSEHFFMPHYEICKRSRFPYFSRFRRDVFPLFCDYDFQFLVTEWLAIQTQRISLRIMDELWNRGKLWILHDLALNPNKIGSTLQKYFERIAATI